MRDVDTKECVKFKKDYVAYISFAAFILIVICEVVLAVSIPLYLNRSTAMAHEVRRIKLMNSFDNVRSQARRIKCVNSNAELERNLVVWELNKLANYMRDNVEFLASDEIAELQRIVNESGAILTELEQQKSFSKAETLDTAVFVDAVMNRKIKK